MKGRRQRLENLPLTLDRSAVITPTYTFWLDP